MKFHLKKILDIVNIYNGVVTDIKKWSSNVPSDDIDVYKKGEMERPTQYGKDTQRLEVDRKVLTSETVMKNKELRQTLVRCCI